MPKGDSKVVRLSDTIYPKAKVNDMTKQQFISRQNSMGRNSRNWMIAFFVIYFGFLLANIPIAQIVDRQKDALGLRVLYIAVIFTFVIGCVPLLLWFAKHQHKKFGLSCPKCGKGSQGLF